MSSVIIHLDIDLPVQHLHTALAPGLGLLELREECSCVEHALSFEQQMVSLLRIVADDVFGMSVVVHKEFGEELGCEGRGVDEKLELDRLVLQTVAHLKRPPCITAVFSIILELAVVCYLIFGLADLHIRILSDPVYVLLGPLYCIFLVSAHAVCPSHRGKPLVTMKLPAKLVVLHRPVAPVDVFPIVI